MVNTPKDKFSDGRMDVPSKHKTFLYKRLEFIGGSKRIKGGKVAQFRMERLGGKSVQSEVYILDTCFFQSRCLTEHTHVEARSNAGKLRHGRKRMGI
jgi:hypothetical protein